MVLLRIDIATPMPTLLSDDTSMRLPYHSCVAVIVLFSITTELPVAKDRDIAMWSITFPPTLTVIGGEPSPDTLVMLSGPLMVDHRMWIVTALPDDVTSVTVMLSPDGAVHRVMMIPELFPESTDRDWPSAKVFPSHSPTARAAKMSNAKTLMLTPRA